MAVVQGFGKVASYAAHELHHFGLKVIEVSDTLARCMIRAASIYRH
jgi:glutamate dehydrogenase/leucine dehydrogenase